MVEVDPFMHYRYYIVIFCTSQCRKEALKDATNWSKDEVTKQTGDKAAGESKSDHNQTSYSHVYNNEVERLTELLVRSSNKQC